MNKQLCDNIMLFGNSVAEYLRMEYDPVYYEKFNSKNLHMFDFIGGYYMGGNNVPDTARYVVESMNNGNL